MARTDKPTYVSSASFREEEVLNLQPGDHHCHVFETPEQSLTVLAPFLEKGLQTGDKCVSGLSETSPSEVCEALEERGIDTEARLAAGDLAFQDAREAYGESDDFDVEARIEDLRTMVQQAREDGYENLRSAGEMSWAGKGGLDRETLVRYETELERFFHEEGSEHLIGLCQYHLSAFEPSLMSEVVRAHPVTIHGSRVRPHVLDPPPEEPGWDPAEPDAEPDRELSR